MPPAATLGDPTPAMRILSTLLLLSLPIAAQPPDWRQWRGPTRDGMVAKGSPAWPARLNAGNLKRLWSVDLAEGYSSPVIAGRRVFTVETRDRKNEIVRAFDRQTGEPLWETSWPGSMKVPFFASKNGSWVRSTPATDGSSLFVGGMRDVLVAWMSRPARRGGGRTSRSRRKPPAAVRVRLLADARGGLDLTCRSAPGCGASASPTARRCGWPSRTNARCSARPSPPRPGRRSEGIDQIVVQTRMMLAGVKAGLRGRPLVDSRRGIPRHEHPDPHPDRRSRLHRHLRRRNPLLRYRHRG